MRLEPYTSRIPIEVYGSQYNHVKGNLVLKAAASYCKDLAVSFRRFRLLSTLNVGDPGILGSTFERPCVLRAELPEPQTWSPVMESSAGARAALHASYLRVGSSSALFRHGRQDVEGICYPPTGMLSHLAL